MDWDQTWDSLTVPQRKILLQANGYRLAASSIARQPARELSYELKQRLVGKPIAIGFATIPRVKEEQ